VVISGLKVVDASCWRCGWLVNPNRAGESLVGIVVPKSLKIAKPGNLRSSNLRSPLSCVPTADTDETNATWFVGVAISFPSLLEESKFNSA